MWGRRWRLFLWAKEMEISEDIICDFRRFFPPFSDRNNWPSEIIRQQMIEADCITGGRCWGKFNIDDDHNLKKRGMYFYTAHLLAYFFGNSANDPTNVEASARLNIASKSVGDESVSYRITAMESTIDDAISTTVYGVQFMTLRRRCSAVPRVA